MINLDSLPKELWQEICKYLDDRDITALMLVGRNYFRDISSLNAVWQPLLNRLRAIDQTISIKNIAFGQTREVFLSSYDIVIASLKEEAEILRKNEIDDQYALIKNINFNNHLTLSELEELDAQLNTYNSDIIRPIIDKSISSNSNRLDLSLKRLTRIPKEILRENNYINFFNNL